MAIKLSELEGRAIRDNLEKIRLREDKDRMYDRLVELRGKFNDLVTSKSALQEQLLSASGDANAGPGQGPTSGGGRR